MQNNYWSNPLTTYILSVYVFAGQNFSEDWTPILTNFLGPASVTSQYMWRNLVTCKLLVGWLVDLAIFSHISTWKQEIPNLRKFKWRGRESKPGPLAPQAKSLTTRPPLLPTCKLRPGLLFMWTILFLKKFYSPIEDNFFQSIRLMASNIYFKLFLH